MEDRIERQNKRLYIIPGFGETILADNYQEIVEYAKESNFEIIPITISWNKNKLMSDYIEEARKQLPDDSPDCLLGFSFGAYISYVLSQEKKFADYIFCTISPYFKESIKDLPKDTKKFWGINFLEDVKKNSLHKGNKSRAWFLTGQKDWPLAIDVNQKAREMWSGDSDFILIKEAGHELAHENYVEEVKWIIKKKLE